MKQPRLLAAGDTALTVELGDAAALEVSLRVLDACRRIEAATLAGVVEVVPAIRSLTVHYDPCATSGVALRAAIAPLLADVAPGGPASVPAMPEPVRRWLIPACYEPAFGLDIMAVAERCGLTPPQVASLHAGATYRVMMVGFLPGHPYMSELPAPLQIPRRDTPRTSVSPGSVAIATTMSVIYPQESPGGWHIVARTPVRLFDPSWAVPSLLAPGDEVRFRPIDRAELEALAAAAAAGTWTLAPVEEAR